MDKIILKPGRDRSLRSFHPWVFSGAIDQWDLSENGGSARVVSDSGEDLGCGYFNRQTSIAGRMLCFDRREPLDALRDNIRAACAIRARLIGPSTTGFRVINSEGDNIPGLVVDRYADVLVIQVGTLGMQLLLPTVIELLVSELNPKALYEKSLLPSRKEEGLESQHGFLYGESPDEVQFTEHGLTFIAALQDSQKTGFFLDQREMRAAVEGYARQRSVLNCFAYSGGFSAYALRGGATQVISLDSSASACALASRNIELNFPGCQTHQSIVDDVFDFLRKDQRRFDLIILDPPAFAKHRGQVEKAVTGYREINRVAMNKLTPGGVLVTCSCSHFVDPTIFQRTVFEAARDAKRGVQILQNHSQAADHPINLYHPEGSYLKSLVLWVG